MSGKQVVPNSDINISAMEAHALNSAAINEAGISYTWSGCNRMTMRICEKGVPIVDFYPHTGLYKILIEGKFRSDGVGHLIKWIKAIKARRLKPRVEL